MTDSSETSRLSIGAVAEATDIPAATLRTWERRYGFPDPERTESGHRRYRPSVVHRLRLVSRALDAGHRASDVVGLSEEALTDLLSETDRTFRVPPATGTATRELSPMDFDGESNEWVYDWLSAAAALDDVALERQFRAAWNQLGALAFLETRAAPFLVQVGEAWARDQFSVAHEHYASEKLREFLAEQWRPMHERSSGPTVVCATAADELHALGLHLIAVVFGLADWQIVFLGADVPDDDIATATREADADAVAISFAESYDPHRAVAFLESVRETIPENALLLAGGRGSPEGIDGVQQFDSLRTLHAWAAERA